jgi:1-phosphatidylinositol-4-phosphate 5-kinase
MGKYDDFNLAPDILAQADVIRRERLERRQKKMSLLVTSPPPAPAPELVPTAPSTATPVEAKTAVKRRETEETKVLVGNLVGEGHRNYVLMYNMLTGIRVAVSRCQAKIGRPLTEEDYLSRHKYSFDMLGNELTPSAKYDFKFKDYAPWVFRELRDSHFHLDPADYLLSLTAKYILSEIGSPGKSGSFFYYSRDYRFIIKTISHREHNFLRSILKDYHEHVRANPHTLLSRFYGLHRVKMPRGRKIHFVIMNNLFPPHRDIHETYDLKGSAFGREYPEDKAKNNPRAVLKDINWVNRGRTFEFGPEKRALFTEQLRRDMEFLRRINVMDYSLLVGIHNMERGNRDNLRLTKLRVFNPDTSKSGVVNRKPSAVKSHAEAHSVRRAVTRSDPKSMLDASVNMRLPEEGAPDRRHFIFYQDEGGLRATDEQNNPMDIIYYLGIIDICTPYNFGKRVEHAWKSISENPVTISCVQPSVYGDRFFDFLQSVMRGGDLKLRPQGLEPPPVCAGSPVGTLNPAAQAPASFGRDPTVIAQRHDSEAHAIALQTSPTVTSHPHAFDNAVVNPDSNAVVNEEKTSTENEAMLPMLPGSITQPPAPMDGYGAVEEKAADFDRMNGHAQPAMVGHLKAD